MNGMLIAATQVSVILLVALGLAWLLRKRTASLRHAVLMIALACAAIVPVLGEFMPPWASRAIVMPSVFGTHPAFNHLSAPGLAQPDAPGAGSTRQSSSGGANMFTQDAQPHGTVPPEQSRNWRASLPRLLDAAYVAYSAGLIISLATLVIGLLRLRWIAAHAEPMRSKPWQRHNAAIATAYRLRRTVRLALGTHASVLATWGIARPQVLLPAGAEDWPDDRIRAVLLHELAHIRRNDWIVQVLAGVLRAIYWFNPLIWMACARLRQEAEQACDDAAIEQGEDGAEYAAHLLALARTLMRPATMWAPAPSMARRSTLQRRIEGILDPATTHASTTRMSVARVTTVLLLVTWAVAACRVVQPPLHALDMRPHQSGAGVARREVKPPAAVESVPTTGTDSPLVGDTAPPKPAGTITPPMQAPNPAAVVTPGDASPAPQMVAAGILDLVQSTLADDSSVSLDELTYPITGLHHVQRFAQAVVNDDGRNPAALAANCIEIINALGNTADLATHIASRPGGPRLSPPRFEQLAAALRAKAAELAAVVMPAPAVTSIIVSTPGHRAAISALDLAQTTLGDASFAAHRGHAWLVTELNTLDRAAQSVVNDDDTNQSIAAAKLYALRSSVRSTARQAREIAGRANETAEGRRKAADLAIALRRIETRFDAATSSPVLSNPGYGPQYSTLERATGANSQ